MQMFLLRIFVNNTTSQKEEKSKLHQRHFWIN